MAVATAELALEPSAPSLPSARRHSGPVMVAGGLILLAFAIFPLIVPDIWRCRVSPAAGSFKLRFVGCSTSRSC
jgi:hypothetical protein